jgi:nitrogen regulatory protein P-II 1
MTAVAIDPRWTTPSDPETVLNAAAKCANTGTIGDGKIWVTPVDSVLRVRTGDRDDDAV